MIFKNKIMYYFILIYVLISLITLLKIIGCFRRELCELIFTDLLVAFMIAIQPFPLSYIFIYVCFAKNIRKTYIIDYIVDKFNYIINMKIY